MGALKDDVFGCEVCGNIILVIEGGGGDLKCCGEPMLELSPRDTKPYADTLGKAKRIVVALGYR